MEKHEWAANLRATLQTQQITSSCVNTDQVLFRRHLTAVCETFVAGFDTTTHYPAQRTAIRTHAIKAAVAGPKGSGKSTLLHILASDILLEHAMKQGTWLYQFFVPINWSLYLKDGVDIAVCYCELVQHFIDLLHIQRPQLRCTAIALAQFWKRLVSQKHLPTLPNDFADNHESALTVWRRYARRIQTAYHGRQYGVFLSTLMALPGMFKETMGFKSVLFLFDNVEATGVQFANHWSDNSAVNASIHPYVMEQMKQHLVVATACTTLAARKGSMDVRDMFGDTIPAVRRLATPGLISNTLISQVYPNLPTQIHCGGRQVSSHVFGGCPAYVAHFINMMLSPSAQSPTAEAPDDSQCSAGQNRQAVEFYGRAVEMLIRKLHLRTEAKDQMQFAAWGDQFAQDATYS
eukprot:NODE_1467_length_1324_cov_78.096909_g1454_i0.p1 GENE.NODE_1467_length_1324_cov_78.096909_g1454_i0~~NODE_1467_length_1324_cov_78.096909_g1454_i0.p1  ORF type:complete len:430 (-),score=118.66 NODE_1467_length_1324_cov_78.096909_g1454_i0:33-1247(-)